MLQDRVFKRSQPSFTTVRPPDQIVRAGESVDTVDLDEPQILEHRFQVIVLYLARNAAQKQMLIEKEAAGGSIVEERSRNRPDLSPLSCA